MATAKEIANSLRRGGQGQNAMSHLVRRMAVLTGDGGIEYSDWHRSDEGNLTDGTAVLFTADRVVLATAAGSGWELGVDNEAGPSTVDVTCWSRRSLVAVSIDSDQSGNRDNAWAQEWWDEWPVGSQLTLHYAGRGDPLVLPLAERPNSLPEGFADFAESVLSDLTND